MQNYKKKPINKALRNSVWNNSHGEEIGTAKCFAGCGATISQQNFECGHVKSEKDGGSTTLENLKPICSTCNKSMGTKHMKTFCIETGLYKKSGFYDPNEPDDSDTDNYYDICCEIDKIFDVSTEENIIKIFNDLQLLDYIDHILKRSAENGYIKLCEYALINGAHINYRNHIPIRLAIRENHIDIVKYLDSKGGNTSSGKCYGIKQAVLNNYVEMVKYLLETSTHKDKNQKNITSLINTAKRKKYNELIAYLQDFTNLKNNSKGILDYLERDDSNSDTDSISDTTDTESDIDSDIDVDIDIEDSDSDDTYESYLNESIKNDHFVPKTINDLL